MEESIKSKIIPFSNLTEKIRTLQKEGKTVVQTHGVFDLIHPGHIKHLNSARSEGDILVATVIRDVDVRRGPGRPVFPDALRAENLASLQQVDFVSIVNDETPFECVKALNPDVFAKGKTHKEREQKIDEKIGNIEKELNQSKAKIHETEGFSFSSSTFVNSFMNIYPDETRNYLENFKNKYSFQNISETLNNLSDLKVLLIGDGILDEYHYCESMGKSAKAHLVVNKALDHEVFNGGAFAVANHIASLCDSVQLVSLLGKKNSQEEFIRNNLKPNVSPHFFYRNDGPTIVKKRYINQYLNQKLFEINYLNGDNICESDEDIIIEYLESAVPDFDLLLVSDFGHGLISKKIINTLEKISKTLAVNTQTNGANRGFNLITKYNSATFLCLDEPEVRLATQEKTTEIETVAKKLLENLDAKNLIVTLGKKGSIALNDNRDACRTPIFSSKVVDTVGAGDAFFAYTAPCVTTGVPMEVASFIGNAVGALAVQIVGNKSSVEKYELLEFIHSILK